VRKRKSLTSVQITEPHADKFGPVPSTAQRKWNSAWTHMLGNTVAQKNINTRLIYTHT